MKSLARALGWFSSASMLGVSMQVIKGKASAMFLGPQGVGVLSQLTNAWTFIEIIAGLGLYNGVVKRISEAKSRDDLLAAQTQLSSAVIFMTSFSCFVALLGFYFSSVISDLIFSDQGARAGLVNIALLGIPFSVSAKVYKSLLSGFQLVRAIVIAQVISDFVGLVLFLFFVWQANLLGAVVAFCGLHIAKLIFQLLSVRTAMGKEFVFPDFKLWKWSEVSINAGYGANGLIMSGLSIGTALLVSRWIIADLGIEKNGVYSIAWRVSALYLGALYAAAGSYYLPSLVGCKIGSELNATINNALRLYLYLLPPVILVLVLGGEWIVWFLFSEEFLGAAALIAVMVPGDLFRVISETVGLSLLAKRKLLYYTVSYIIWALMFLTISNSLMVEFGLMGVAIAYLVSHIISFLLIYLLVHFSLGFRSDSAFLKGMGLAVAMVSLSVFISFTQEDLIVRAGALGFLIFTWGIINWRNAVFRNGLNMIVRKISGKIK